jgi:hypothetical protein
LSKRQSPTFVSAAGAAFITISNRGHDGWQRAGTDVYDVSQSSAASTKVQLKDPAGVSNISWDCVGGSGTKGADYQLAGGSGTTLDARYTLAPSDGNFIIVRNCGPSNALIPVFEAAADAPS